MSTPAAAPATAAAATTQTPAGAAPATAGQPAAQQPAQGATSTVQATTAAQTGAAAVPAALAAMLPPAADAQQPATSTATAKAATSTADAKAPSAEDQIAALRAEINAGKVREAVFNAAAKAGAISPEQVFKLFGDGLDVAADGRVTVKGDPRVTPEQYIARELAANLHLLKPAVPGGGSGSPSTVQAPASGGERKPANTAEGGTANVRAFTSLIFGNASTSAPAPGGAAVTR
jgi:hypothetical protein